MLEEVSTMDLHIVLDVLEDRTLDKPLARNQNYRTFQNVLDSKIEISDLIVDRLLAVCVQDLQEDKQYCHTILKIINSILKRIKTGEFSTLTNLLPSILELLNVMKTTALLSNMETLQKLSFETVVLYPDNVLIDLAMLHDKEVMEVVNSYCREGIQIHIRCLPCELLLKLLQVLPNDKKLIFLKANLKVWFTRLIPTIVLFMQTESLSTKPLETLEALTDGLVHIDYAEDIHWQYVLQSIYNPQKYPLLMRNMLLKGSKCWHRLWIVFIRLLKHQITRICSPGGSPINLLLPVVETAFKMDVANRCRAFQCWDVLIDNFHTETNEANIVKRVKLLIVPLRSNNAKVEETTLAKLNTWWHLIRSFQNRMEKFVDSILISFLHFCFGKHALQNKQPLVPCLISSNTKKRAVEAFIEIAGHLSCSGCVDLPKLNKRIVSKKFLVDYWNDWIFSLKVAISISIQNVGVTQQQVVCAWKSFALIISELPDNNIRKDLFDELLLMLDTMLQYGLSNNNRTESEIIISLICSLFEDDKLKVLFKTKCGQEGPLHKIIQVLMKPTINVYLKSIPIKEVISKLKPIINYVLDDNLCSPDELMLWVFMSDFHQDSILLFWTALSEVLLNVNSTEITNLDIVLLWPLNSSNNFVDDVYFLSLWYKLFEYLYPKLYERVHTPISTFLTSTQTTKTNLLLKVYATIGILNYLLARQENYETPLGLLLGFMDANGLQDFKEIEKLGNILTDTLISMLDDALSLQKINSVNNMMNCIKKIMNLIINHLQNNKMENYMSTLENLLIHINQFLHQCLKRQIYCASVITDELIKLATLLNDQKSIKDCLLSIMKVCLSSIEKEKSAYKEIKSAIINMESNTDVVNKTVERQIKVNENKFTTPEVKIMTRKAKKKEASIVNTVVENGEEFVVVKSNWKFNPRKLTENQKEKLQRKREDIPALYQDLSQSQDEFKLNSWKPDSQDSSTTNSKSSNLEDITTILKNIPSSDVVPKIIENNFSIIAKKEPVECTTAVKSATVTSDITKSNSTPKDTKSPRMALKDRVFRNVRNLIEKSGGQNDNIELSASLIQIENIPKTPLTKLNNTNNLTNSAPTKLNSERPSRLKRKPKKFDDTELFALKRNCRSLSQNDTQPEILGESVKQQQQENSLLQNDDISQCKIVDNRFDEKTLAEPSNNNIGNTVSENNSLNAPIEIKNASSPEVTNSIDGNNQIEKESKGNETKLNETKSIDDDLVPATDAGDVSTDIKSVNEQKKDIVHETSSINENVVTPKSNKKHESNNCKSTVKKRDVKKSRIEKELAIDTVEGHPLLKNNSERRVTRKAVTPLNNTRRKTLTEKLNKSKSDIKNQPKNSTPNSKKQDKNRTSDESEKSCELESIDSSHRLSQTSSVVPEDFTLSEDVIESSQDSTLTTITTSKRNVNKRVSVIVEKCPLISTKNCIKAAESHSNQNNVESPDDSSIHKKSYRFDKEDDSVFPQNKTINENLDSTDNMDTEPIDDKSIELKDSCPSDVIIINDDEELPILINTEDECVRAETQEIVEANTQPTDSRETQEIAEADTQPTDPSETQEIAEADTQPTDPSDFVEDKICDNEPTIIQRVESESNVAENVNINDNEIKSCSEPINISSETDNDSDTVSSPFKDDEQRKRDFLDNTLQISPIKTMSPVRENKSPSPETSNDYVVIQLSSPVQSNGEPFEKCNSPEIFTDDKVSPDKRDLSPPREEINVNNNSSPSSSLSLRKNKPQVRSGGRAAQMLGLCVPDRLQTIIHTERSETEEPKKSSPSNTPARRNLRILYNSVGENNENSEENEDSENFLKFKRSLPTSDCSPSGPILKRKLAEITDEATITPASKRKRVSFHDPPVSTMVSVHKYIEPCGVRSPQNSALKRQERQNLRSQTTLKSPKRLDNVFKLDSVLTKAVESFTEIDRNADDTQSMTLDETPALEIIRNSDLNDTDPLCPELLDCTDPIEVIACDLSSSTMKTMFLKELEGQIATVGDLAKLTELEVNRLCIKAPKVKIAKKVLNDYALKKVFEQTGPKEVTVCNDEANETLETKDNVKMDIETQTIEVVMNNRDTQTVENVLKGVSVQTDGINTCHRNVQTIESGSKSTKDIITTCVAEKPDFIQQLTDSLEESSKVKIAEAISFDALTDAFMNKVTTDNSKILINKILEKQNVSETDDRNRELSFLLDYVCERFENKDLILFCSQLLANVHARPS
ncbi:unnamed protein product [Diatraea saccharalis]|uniref:Telomere-associated protein RIF1 n=1 Tax=Diatraea saccharalis TaxID=40085 RepID=A0A9P0G0N2_9NEOP|nr:unnamed protein product [Diatraea saccharalis]